MGWFPFVILTLTMSGRFCVPHLRNRTKQKGREQKEMFVFFFVLYINRQWKAAFLGGISFGSMNRRL